MSKGIAEQELRQIVRRVLEEKLAKRGTEVVAETTEEKTSDDEWYGSTLYESLKRKWTK